MAIHLIKYSVALVLLRAGACRANILLTTSRPNETTSSVVEATVNIVTSCYSDKINGILLAGNLPHILVKTLAVQHTIPVVTITGVIKTPLPYTRRMYSKFHHKLDVFILEASSLKQIDRLVRLNIWYSIWWNQMASVFLLDLSTTCTDASNYLHQAFDLGMINAKLVCNHHKNGIIILSHNPFTSQAPNSWHQFESFRRKYDHPFTVFSRVYRENKTMCADLDFEKMDNLGGSSIIIGQAQTIPIRTASNRGSYEFRSIIHRILDGFHDVLNATLITDEKLSKNSDFVFRPVMLQYGCHSSITTYPHQHIGSVFVSRFRDNKSHFKKMLCVIDENSQYGMIIVYMITLLFFKFFVRQALVDAFLNLVRITCNARLANLPVTTASRIYLGCLILFAVTMQVIYQGNLASVKKNIPVQNLNTVQEFVDFGYKEVCGSFGSITMIDHPVLQKSFIKLYGNECFTKIRRDPLTAACMLSEGYTLDETQKFKLHMSERPIMSMYTSFCIRQEWPLEEKINKIIQRFVEADMLKPWDSKCDPIKFTDFQFVESVKNNQKFMIVELRDLSFAFVILGVGLTCATVTLIVELVVSGFWTCSVSFVKR